MSSRKRKASGEGQPPAEAKQAAQPADILIPTEVGYVYITLGAMYQKFDALAAAIAIRVAPERERWTPFSAVL